MLEKLAITQTAIHELIAKRWSVHAFESSKPVHREQIIALVETARWAPSCYGDQPWRYIICDKNTHPAAWEKAFSCLAELNQQWVINVPLLILATADSNFKFNGKPNRWSQYDTGAASENLCLQAVAMGLVAHQMGGFNVDKARELFNIPAQIIPMAMIAIGHQADPQILADTYKSRELATRVRNPLEEHFFEGGWDIPIESLEPK